MGQSVRLCDQGVRRGGCVEGRRRVALTSYAARQVYSGENLEIPLSATGCARMDTYVRSQAVPNARPARKAA